MNLNQKRAFNLSLRYTFLILIAIPNLWIFYAILTPLTVYPVYALLNLFFNAVVIGNIIVINENIALEIIRACVAGSAYYLLLVLNLSIPSVKLNKRVKMVLFSFGLLLAINIIRIFSLSLIFLEGFSFFVLTHKVFWYLLSTIFIVGIWFIEVKYFKIKEIPFYSDLRFLYKNSSLK